MNMSRKTHTKNRSPLGNEDGSALIVALWVSIILAVLAMEVAYSTRLDMRTANYHLRRVQADTLVRGAVDRALNYLSVPENRTAAPLQRLDHGQWRFQEINSPAELPVNLMHDNRSDEAGKYFIEIIDDSGKIDVNTTDAETLERLFTLLELGAPAALAADIIAFRDTRPGAHILCVDELLDVRSVDEKILYGEDANNNGVLDPAEDDGDGSEPADNRDGELQPGLAAFLTAWPHSKISINRAPLPVVGAVMDWNTQQRDAFRQLRDARNDHIASLDDLKNLGIGADVMDIISERFTVDSDRFRVRAEAVSPSGNVQAHVLATVAVDDRGPRTVLWREY